MYNFEGKRLPFTISKKWQALDQENHCFSWRRGLIGSIKRIFRIKSKYFTGKPTIFLDEHTDSVEIKFYFLDLRHNNI